MTLLETFHTFHKKLKERHSNKSYDLLLKKTPFIEEEDGIEYSSVHDLIEDGWLEFISLDIGSINSTKYTVHLSDKALKEIEKITN